MKTLKLDHELATLVKEGKKTVTWRLYDDKDIQVNDQVILIDKVEASSPETWKEVGEATVDMIVEKRLGEISKDDFIGHEQFVSREEMLKTYQGYYGAQVTFQTPVKMVHFTLSDKTHKSVVKNIPKLKTAKMYADGGSRGNPGPSASGFAIMDMDSNIVVKKGIYLGITTNNQAEYHALRLGLEEARNMGIREVHVFMDSLLVVNQMLGIFKVKNRDLWPIHESIKNIASNFDNIYYKHVPRELNKIADSAVNEALDQAAERQ